MHKAIDDRVSIEVVDNVAHVMLIRRDKLNALDARMFEALDAAAEWTDGQESVRAVVLSGDGRGFCAGFDLSHVDVLTSPGGREAVEALSHGDANLFQRAALAWHDLRVPVIGALHGVVYGGGLQIALGADLRFCAPDARLSLMETRWSLIPDMGVSVLLRRLVRSDVARDLIFSARVFDAAEALSLGIVTRISADPLADALAYARDLATKSPRALATAKALLNEADDAHRGNLLRHEAKGQMGLMGAEDHIETINAHRDSRSPVFR